MREWHLSGRLQFLALDGGGAKVKSVWAFDLGPVPGQLSLVYCLQPTGGKVALCQDDQTASLGEVAAPLAKANISAGNNQRLMKVVLV